MINNKPISSKDKAFIAELSRLYLQYGNFNIVARRMKIKRTSLYEQIERILKAKLLFPIRTRKVLILSLKIRKKFNKINNIARVAKIYGLSTASAKRYLKYGSKVGLFEYPASLKKRKYKIIPISTKKHIYSKQYIKDIRDIKREYDKAGSLKKAAKKYNVSHETIRQILKLGNRLGLFEFPPKEEKLYSRITKEKLQGDLLKYESLSKLSKYYKVSLKQLKEAIEKHDISMVAIELELNRQKALKTYQDLTKELGHHPSTTEIRERHGYLLRRIKKGWSSIYNFRKYYAFPNTKFGPRIK